MYFYPSVRPFLFWLEITNRLITNNFISMWWLLYYYYCLDSTVPLSSSIRYCCAVRFSGLYELQIFVPEFKCFVCIICMYIQKFHSSQLLSTHSKSSAWFTTRWCYMSDVRNIIIIYLEYAVPLFIYDQSTY